MKTLEFIEEDTLICEYGGEVFFLKNKLFGKNNSIMDIIISKKSDKSLVICPEKNCNFIKIYTYIMIIILEDIIIIILIVFYNF